MRLCAACGQPLLGSVDLCPQHAGGPPGGWATGNRIMCDFFHRGIAPHRLSTDERADDLTRRTAA